MADKSTSNPRINYASREQVATTAKLALLVHGPAFRELARR